MHQLAQPQSLLRVNTVPEPSQEEQVSEFERLRLGQIQRNRAQLALLGLGESAPIVSGDAPKAASKARPRPGRNDGPLRRSARLGDRCGLLGMHTVCAVCMQVLFATCRA